MENYAPPFVITNEILGYVSSITEKVGRIASFDDFSKFPLLRRQNRIKSIQSSCAIEANSLTLGQVEDVINGQRVVGPSKDIIEVKNAIRAYEEAFSKDPFSEKDLLFAHSLMTEGLIKDSGKYRTGGEGVIDGNGDVIFVAPPGKMVPELMSGLLRWAKENFGTLNALILSSVFHYEFVFIHPFGDGNGRMARLWQNLILSKWRPIFEFMPIESLIEEHQSEYYKAIDSSNHNGDSTDFIAFMLRMIDLSIDGLASRASIEIENANAHLSRLLEAIVPDKWYTRSEIQCLLGLSDRANFTKNYLSPALRLGLVEMEFPDKPTSRVQRYRKKR